MAGRRDDPLHRTVECEENSVPEVMMDYCFVRRDDEAEVDVARDVVEFTKVFEPDPRRIKVLPRSWRRHGLFRRPR